MEQSPPQDIMRGLPRVAPANPSLPPDYWNPLDALYSNDPPPHQQPPQLQPHHPQQSQTQPLGIGWDHPVFNQRPPQQPSRSPLPLQQQQPSAPPPQQDQSHGLYSSSNTPQSWRGTPLQHQPIMPQTPQTYGISTQYRPLQPLQPYPQSQLTLDSRSLATPDSAAFPQSFAYPRDYYPQHLSVPDAFPQASSPQTVSAQPTISNAFQNDTSANSINPYSLPAGFPDDSLNSQVQFPSDFTEPTPNIPSHQTINPQFLNSQQAAGQHSSLNNFVYMNPAEFARQNDPKTFDYFRNDLQMPPAFNQPTIHHPQNLSQGSNALPANGHVFPTTGVPGNAVDQRRKQPSIKKQTKKPTTKGLSKKVDGRGSASSSSESETDDSDLEIELPEEPSPIPPTRPIDPEAAVQYDTLKAVWFPRNRRPNADKVKSALVAFKDVVKTVRDTWKEKSQAMKMAENKNESDKAAKIKTDVVLQRRLMDTVVRTTLDKGHPMIVEKLGEHPMAVAAMYSFLLDRHQASDIDGAFNISLLKLLSRFVTMDEDVLQKTNVAKLLPRYVKKGGPIVKELAQKILDNAAASTKRKQDTSKTGPSKEGSPSKNSAADMSDGQRNETAGSKRPREGESNGQPATKRMIVTSNLKNNTKPSNSIANGPAKRPQVLSQESKATSVAAARPKANLIAPKPTNLFGSLSSASKRPGTSNAERAAAAAAAAKSSPPAEKKEAQPPPPRPTFSFGDIMADLNKQKEPAPSQVVEERPPETEEERTKRLRKEARRKLRVTWKPDNSLTEVRFFTHDPDEELGPGDRSREAGDVKGEGSVLKLHKNLDELGEDEDSGLREETLLDYYEPTEIDTEDIEDRSRNFVKRAGNLPADSPEKVAQDHREATTLMVFYTSPADVPSTPKEPPPVDSEETIPEAVSFGELPDHVKARQERYFAMTNPQRAAAPQQAPPNASFDISNILKIIQNAPQQPQQSTPPPAPQPAPQAPMSDLERTINMFRQQQPPAAPAVAPMPQFPTISQPPSTQGIDFQKILSAMNPQMQQPTIPPPAQSQPTMPANLAAIISQLSNPGAQANPNPTQLSNTYEDPERKRMREGAGYDGQQDDGYNFKRNKPNSAPNKRHPKAGLVACRYWAEGRCRKGDECTYRHDPLN